TSGTCFADRLRPWRNFETALHGWPRKTALPPRPAVRQAVELHEFACSVKSDEIAHPAQKRNVGDGEEVAHHPLAPGQPGLEDTEETFRLCAVALERAFVLDLPPGELVKVPELAEHRTAKSHLEEPPLDGLVALRGIGRQEFTRLLREIEQDRARFE